MKKLILFALILSAFMYAEYHYIMTHITPTYDGNTLYLEVCGQVDVYDFE